MCRRGGAPRRRLPLTGVMPPKPSRLLSSHRHLPGARALAILRTLLGRQPSAVRWTPEDTDTATHARARSHGPAVRYCQMSRSRRSWRPASDAAAPWSVPDSYTPSSATRERWRDTAHAFTPSATPKRRRHETLTGRSACRANARSQLQWVRWWAGGREPIEFVGVLLQFGRRHPPRVEWALPHRRRRSQSPSALAQRKPWH